MRSLTHALQISPSFALRRRRITLSIALATLGKHLKYSERVFQEHAPPKVETQLCSDIVRHGISQQGFSPSRLRSNDASTVLRKPTEREHKGQRIHLQTSLRGCVRQEPMRLLQLDLDGAAIFVKRRPHVEDVQQGCDDDVQHRVCEVASWALAMDPSL